MAAVIKDQVEKALPGVTLNIKVEPKKQRVADIQEGNYEVCLTRWGPDYKKYLTFNIIPNTKMPERRRYI